MNSWTRLGFWILTNVFCQQLFTWNVKNSCIFYQNKPLFCLNLHLITSSIGILSNKEMITKHFFETFLCFLTHSGPFLPPFRAFLNLFGQTCHRKPYFSLSLRRFEAVFLNNLWPNFMAFYGLWNLFLGFFLFLEFLSLIFSLRYNFS